MSKKSGVKGISRRSLTKGIGRIIAFVYKVSPASKKSAYLSDESAPCENLDSFTYDSSEFKRGRNILSKNKKFFPFKGENAGLTFAFNHRSSRGFR